MEYVVRYYTNDQAYWRKMSQSELEVDRQIFHQHEEILKLLQAVTEKHGISHEIFPLSNQDDVVTKVYHDHFLSHSSVLKARLGETVGRALRSRQGRGHYYIQGRIAILEDGQVGWITGSKSSFSRFASSDYNPFVRSDTLLFLDGLLRSGASLLTELCFTVAGNPEELLIDRFERSGTLQGAFRRNVLLKAGKQIDMICRTTDTTWIVEAKTQLNWESFGQVIGYEVLYLVEHADEKTQKAIVCGSGDVIIEALCKVFDIAIFNEETKFTRQ